MSAVLVGVPLCVLGTLVYTCGLLLLKRAAVVEVDLPFFRRRLFWAGVLCTLFNTFVIDIAVFALCPLALIAPFAGLVVVFTNVRATVGGTDGSCTWVSKSRSSYMFISRPPGAFRHRLLPLLMYALWYVTKILK